MKLVSRVAAALLLLTDEGVVRLGPRVASTFSPKPFTLPQAVPPSTIFRIETDEFWLNLHHFLYVVGRAQAKSGDATREAVADAPAEAERGLRTLTAEEQSTWRDAVTFYASGLSLKDAIREDPMPTVTAMLADADDAPTLAGVATDAPVRQALERATPAYRKAWWPAHRTANRAWRASMEALVAQHGQAVLDFITRAYGLQWPVSGFAVHASRFSNWAGAYSSTRGPVCDERPRTGLLINIVELETGIDGPTLAQQVCDIFRVVATIGEIRRSEETANRLYAT
jgi:hypothetical protein